MNVTVKGSGETWKLHAVTAIYEWLNGLYQDDVNGFLTVVDLALTGTPPSQVITDEQIAKGNLESDGSVQTTRRDLIRLMVAGSVDDPVALRIRRWEELEVTEVA